MAEPVREPVIRALVVEDEGDLREATVTYLRLEGIDAHGVGSLAAADMWLDVHPIDVLVLDLGLPDGDGLRWLDARPALQAYGLVLTTARGAAVERIRGAEAGVDVYLVKPVDLEELVPVVRNVARRIRLPAPAAVWTLHEFSWTLTSPAGRGIRLTRTESLLLRTLAETPGQSVPRRRLVEAFGEAPDAYDLRRMEILVRRLRNKVQADAGVALPMDTVHGVGYAFVAPITVMR